MNDIPNDLKLQTHWHLLTERQREVLPQLDGERWVTAKEVTDGPCGRAIGICLTALSKTPLVESHVVGPSRRYWITPLGCAVVDMMENG